uniref:CCHC-type domain-containing protein n=1 Tax=Pseudonaja textilis TaxID=8673 RepID=A0A670ZKV4_PSETE
NALAQPRISAAPQHWRRGRNTIRGYQMSDRRAGAGQRNNFTPKQPPICLSCGGSHLRASCRFRNATCLNCQRKSHLARICQPGRTFPQRPQPTANFQRQLEDCYTCYHADHISKTFNKISIFVFLEGNCSKKNSMNFYLGTTLNS